LELTVQQVLVALAGTVMLMVIAALLVVLPEAEPQAEQVEQVDLQSLLRSPYLLTT
jgi:hypothetical protein